MTPLRHLFVIDPLEKLNLKLDSSLRIAFALTKKKHRCFITTPKLISQLHNPGYPNEFSTVWSTVQEIQFGHLVSEIEIGRKEYVKIAAFNSIHMRKDPPFDMDYLASTWLLDEMANHGTVYNSPAALRRWNEKLIIMRYPQFTNPALFSANPAAILDFIKNHASGNGIIKPLDLFGGHGVVPISLKDLNEQEALKKIEEITANGENFRITQPFDTKVYEGEVRVFCAGETPLSWCLKVPDKGQFLANTRAGATLHPYQPSRDELEMVSEVAADLKREGIFFTGFDLIGGKISEINITSPRLLVANESEDSYYDELCKLLLADLGQTR